MTLKKVDLRRVLEGGVVDDVKKRFASTGWLHRKVVYAGRRGAGDDWFFAPRGAVMVIIEFKRPKKDATLQQAREHDRLRQRGFRVFVVDTAEKGYAIHAQLEAEINRTRFI